MNRELTFIYNGQKGRRKLVCTLNEDDTLTIVRNSSISDFKVYPQNLSQLSESPSKKGLGEIVASATKLFGAKPCAPCDRRRKYLNEITPNWAAKQIEKLYRGKEKD
jgi:hypothetical protein